MRDENMRFKTFESKITDKQKLAAALYFCGLLKEHLPAGQGYTPLAELLKSCPKKPLSPEEKEQSTFAQFREEKICLARELVRILGLSSTTSVIESNYGKCSPILKSALRNIGLDEKDYPDYFGLKIEFSSDKELQKTVTMDFIGDGETWKHTQTFTEDVESYLSRYPQSLIETIQNENSSIQLQNETQFKN